jgi:hypothetical protein
MLPILIAASIAAVPEVELQMGYMGGGGADPKAIALSLRAGVDFRDIVALSALLVDVPGPDASYHSGYYTGPVAPDPSGMSGWAALAELRLHTPGAFQVFLGGAAGIGKLANWQCGGTSNCTENDILHGHPALMLQGSAGIRIVPAAWGGFNVGVEVAMPLWNGQEDVANLALHPPWQSRASPRLMWAVLATVGYRFP